MRYLLMLISLSAFLFLNGCASNNPGNNPGTTKKSTKLFSATERNRMLLCMGRSETIRFMAISKLRKVPKEKIKKFYESRKYSKLNLALLDKVYKDEMKDPWLYAINYFKDCSVKNAGIPTELTKLASYCALNTYIAGDVNLYKKRGLSKEETLNKYNKLKGNGPKEIVDRVYASSNKRGKDMAITWDLCMDKVAEK